MVLVVATSSISYFELDNVCAATEIDVFVLYNCCRLVYCGIIIEFDSR